VQPECNWLVLFWVDEPILPHNVAFVFVFRFGFVRRKDWPKHQKDLLADGEGRIEKPSLQPIRFSESGASGSALTIVDGQLPEHQADHRLDLAGVAGCSGTLYHFARPMIENAVGLWMIVLSSLTRKVRADGDNDHQIIPESDGMEMNT
jgi:hypothetical protein